MAVAAQTARAVPVWRVYGASCTGASHQSAGKPYEDAWRVHPASAKKEPEPVVAVAVSDGHGHARHFRSARGAELAVELATTLGRQLAHEVRDLDDVTRVRKAVRARVGRDLVAGWRSAVIRDIEARPITAAERSAAGMRDDATTEEKVYAYGATLILVVAGGGWLMSVQIGDGDLFAIGASGEVQRLVSADPRLDGSRTTSLCQPDAFEAMRFGVARLGETASGAILLATDGYANAQARADWDVAFGADLAGLAAVHGTDWIVDHLPRWTAQCASYEGSGDDVTVALMLIDGTVFSAKRRTSAGGAIVPAPGPAAEAPTMMAMIRARFGSAWVGGVVGALVAVVAMFVYTLVR